MYDSAYRALFVLILEVRLKGLVSVLLFSALILPCIARDTYDLSTVEKAQNFLMNIPPAIRDEELVKIVYSSSSVKVLIDFDAAGSRALSEFAGFRNKMKELFPEKVASSNENEIVFKLDTPGLTGKTSITVKPSSIAAQIRVYKPGDIKVISQDARLGRVVVLLESKGVKKVIEYVIEDGNYHICIDDASIDSITKNIKILKEAADVLSLYGEILEKGSIKKDTIDTLILDCIADYTEVVQKTKRKK
jgi:hypothetical protein